MIQKALQYFAELANTRMEKVEDQVFSTQGLHLVAEPTAKMLVVRSLSGMIEYLQSKFDGETKLLVHVVSPTEVRAFTSYNRDKRRNEIIQADAMIPEFNFGKFHDTEDFIIKLQSAFVKNDDSEIMLKVVGNIEEKAVNTYGDDGVTQSVTAKTGVATLSTVVVPNPVILQPYRTFIEVEQPESSFIFRMKPGPSCAIFESDGGAWKLEAMSKIKTYLEQALHAEIEASRLTIIA